MTSVYLTRRSPSTAAARTGRDLAAITDSFGRRCQQQLRVQEAEAAQLFTAEQNRWTLLNARLDELEQLLGPVK